MTNKAITAVLALVLTTVIIFISAVTLIFGGGPATACTAHRPTNPRSGSAATPQRTGKPARIGRFNAEQVANATVITDVATQLGVPLRGAVIAVATAIQETDLRNLNHGDNAGPDSRGLFQQRAPWGTRAARRDPVQATRMFFTGGRGGQPGLLDIPSWQTMPLTQAAQAVQHSATPDAYAKHEPDATLLVTTLTGLTDTTGAAAMTCADAPTPSVADMLHAALAQIGKPYRWGATGPDAFDCSGLIVYAWAKAGYHLPVRTAEQLRQVSQSVPPGQQRPGDLLFSEFNTPRVPHGAGHVAIILDDHTLLEAPRPGLRVRVRPYHDTPHTQIGRLPASVLHR